jgi:hypothetical protein
MNMKITYYGDVAAKRAAEYPTLHEQLEMLWDAVAALDEGVPLSEAVQAMQRRIAAVQQKYPYPPEAHRDPA